MTRIAFRCDASLSIGSGHVMRCRNLAFELAKCGAEIFFLCRKQTGDLITLLAQDFSVLTLAENQYHHMPFDSTNARSIYASTLGCCQEKDANDCLDILLLNEINALDWIIVDHYGLDFVWEECISTELNALGLCCATC